MASTQATGIREEKEKKEKKKKKAKVQKAQLGDVLQLNRHITLKTKSASTDGQKRLIFFNVQSQVPQMVPHPAERWASPKSTLEHKQTQPPEW